MHVLARCALVATAILLAGCTEDVTGHWCGRAVDSDAACTGDEVGLLLLAQDGAGLDGQACEAHEHDCHLLEKGTVDGRHVTFHYSFKNGYVDAKLSVEGDVMTGTFFASKCKCDIRRTFYRIP